MTTQQQKRALAVAALGFGILLLDQLIKILVKTHMQLGEEVNILGSWFRIHFIENEGFAFGMKFGGDVGKTALTLFRIVASGALVWYIVRLLRQPSSRTSLLFCLTLITTGAIGNLIDSCFYGMIFNQSYFSVATLFPPEGGYAPFLHGRVVDMFYFPLVDFDWPEWMPLVGGKHFEFFNAIFNLADAAITIGVFWLIIDQLYQAKKQTTHATETTQNEAE